jgi:hypothetical protein
MKLRFATLMLVLLATCGPLTVRPLLAFVAGNASTSVEYIGEVRGANAAEQYRFSIVIEPVIFRLATMQGKYRLLRMRVLNSTSSPLSFSADRDRVEILRRGGTPIAALLNPQQGDAVFWDSLDAGTRDTLAYPVTLKGAPASPPGAPFSSAESIYIYVLVAAAQVTDLPESFRYTIASINQTVLIRTRPATGA